MRIEGPLATGAPLNLSPLQRKENEAMGPTTNEVSLENAAVCHKLNW